MENKPEKVKSKVKLDEATGQSVGRIRLKDDPLFVESRPPELKLPALMERCNGNRP